MGHRTDGTRTLTAVDFTRLLGRLHPDAEQAGQEYERLRRALVKFFDWRGAAVPEECADETLDRLAKRLQETVVDDVRHYAHGIARLVLLERRRGPTMTSIDAHPNVATVLPTMVAEDDRLHDCLERCLSQFPEDSRSLMVRYYEGDGSGRIEGRRRLAGTMGLSDNALRSRVQRLRDRLESCVYACVSEGGDRHS
jgi:DNA-directed RNA polymerase specialized sigma24 family protein